MFTIWRSRIIWTYYTVFFNVHEFIIRRSTQNDSRFDGVRHVIENTDANSHLLSLHASGRHFHVYEEWQHTHVLLKNKSSINGLNFKSVVCVNARKAPSYEEEHWWERDILYT